MTRDGKLLEQIQEAFILRYYAGEGLRKIGDVLPSTDSEAFMYTTRAPLGVVGFITPWNFPVAIPIWKIAPALIYGNAIILKPAREAALLLQKLWNVLQRQVCQVAWLIW